jgi:glycerate kinase
MDSFKGSLSAYRASELVREAISEALPEAEVVLKPMADGGEGTVAAMIRACNGRWIPQKVMGPLPEMQVDAGFAWFEDTQTALVEMASCNGMTLLSQDQLNPLETTTFGTGQLIKAALEQRPKELLLAIGGSATVDVGIGTAMALGWKFLDKNGNPTGLGGKEIERIRTILPPAGCLNCMIKVLSAVDNPLCGPEGAAQVFAPQKGADPQMVDMLDAAILKFSELIQTTLDMDVSSIPGAGAAGGLGAGAVAFMDAEIVSGVDTIIDVVNLKEELQNADWIITGEGKFDKQSLRGKVISGITRFSQHLKVNVAVIAGDVTLDKAEYQGHGITIVFPCKTEDMSIAYAIENVQSLLYNAAGKFTREYLLSPQSLG